MCLGKQRSRATLVVSLFAPDSRAHHPTEGPLDAPEELASRHRYTEPRVKPEPFCPWEEHLRREKLSRASAQAGGCAELDCYVQTPQHGSQPRTELSAVAAPPWPPPLDWFVHAIDDKQY